MRMSRLAAGHVLPSWQLLVLMQDVKQVAWHPGGEVLVSASYDDTIKLWVDADDEWVCVQTLSGTTRQPAVVEHGIGNVGSGG